MEKIRKFSQKHAIKFARWGIAVAAVLLIFGPLLNLMLSKYPAQVIAVSIAILIGVGWLLLDYLSEIKRLIEPTEIHLYPDQQAADNDLRAFIDSARPKEADLIEFSSASVYENIVRPLVRSGSKILLLVQNPKVAHDRFAPSIRQEGRICDQFARRLGTEPEVANYDKIRIRFYGEMASLRGRKFSKKLINVGWFTYDLRQQEMSAATDPVQIWGHNNPLLSIAASDKCFAIVESMFSKVFKNLWDRAKLPKDVCNTCSEKTNGRCPVSDDWLEQVSRH